MRILIFLTLCILYNPQSETILWDSDRKIEWSDFQGKPPENKGNKLAITSSEISVKADFYKGEIPKYIVKSYFIKNESWTITKDEDHLSHERLHFDITEVYSRKIRCQLKALNDENEKDVSLYKNEYKKLLKEYEKKQKEYDSEVYFNKVKQQEWIVNIHKELEELKDYEYIPEK